MSADPPQPGDGQGADGRAVGADWEEAARYWPHLSHRERSVLLNLMRTLCEIGIRHAEDTRRRGADGAEMLPQVCGPAAVLGSRDSARQAGGPGATAAPPSQTLRCETAPGFAGRRRG
jgi:hypothetical protein